jgi:esterase FrsA
MTYPFRVLLAALVLMIAGPALGQDPTPEQALAGLRADVQGRADHQAYPITGMKAEDVREVLAGLHSTDRDEWAAAWSAMGDRYAGRARAAGADKAAAREAWRQAWLHYMFAAWPTQNSAGKRAAYPKSAEAFRQYGALLDPPMETVDIPFEGRTFKAYLQLPAGVRLAPVVISIGGLDEYKEYAVEHFNRAFLEGKLGVLAVDMPGTGEAPVKIDLKSERMFSAAIEYLQRRPEIDGKRIAVQGVSAGGYWSALLSYVERARLRAAVVWGGPVHGYFQADWQRKSFATREYLFGLKEARMTVWGFPDDAAFLAGMPQFSLEKRGLLAQPSTTVLAVNGEKDTQVPIDDLYLLLRTGTPKFAWVNPIGGHVGRSANMGEEKIHGGIIVPWLAQMLAATPQ